MGSDLDSRATEAFFQPSAQRSLLCLRHTGLPALPAVEGKRIPTILQIGFMPAPDGVVVQIQEIRNLLAGFAVVEQQDRICPMAMPWSSRWRRTQASSSMRSAEERKPGRIIGIAGSTRTQPSRHQIRLL